MRHTLAVKPFPFFFVVVVVFVVFVVVVVVACLSGEKVAGGKRKHSDRDSPGSWSQHTT